MKSKPTIKQNKKNKLTKTTILWSLFLLVIVVSLGFYMFQYNIGPFKGDKIGGLQDNHLRTLSSTGEPHTLPFDFYGEYELNYEGKGVELYLDYYEAGSKTDSQLLTSISTEGQFNFGGLLFWGVTPAREEDPSEFEDIFAKMNLSFSQSSTRTAMDFFPQTNEGAYAYVTPSDGSKVLTKDKPLMLLSYTSDGSTYSTYEDFFNGDTPKNNDTFLLLYLLPI
ncbi:hypothetical protein [Marinilactibacillus sp. Marseille-P9653]|uniref:hypothetical protein n=1 Tax=Marinilactibacillus sp. Marseille-P9653 TaxID=2866583 RepID=UPI001CE420D4|nr:hypothetical protein [Marinilactibacillus sp. Marseille-P9653]